MYPGTFAAATPDKAAAIMADTGESISYARLEERSVRLANALRAAGLRTGDGVALLAENCVEYFVVYWAALRGGLYLTALNRHLTAPETAYIVNDCQAKAMIVSARLAPVATELVERTPGVTTRLAFGGPVDGHDDYAAALAAASPKPPADQPLGSVLLYSSGTTGRPKGVKRELTGERVEDHANQVRQLAVAAYGFGPDSVYLSPAPLYHAAPLYYCTAVQELGGTVVVMPRFDAEAALAAIERYRVTHSQWVPTMFVRMLKLPKPARTAHDLSSHRVAVHAAAPCPVAVKRQMIDWWGPILHEYYGATEAIGITMIDSATWLDKPGSVGRAALGVAHVCDADDPQRPELPAGHVGLVYFERDQLPFSYLNDPEQTRRAQHPRHENWGTTGDLGYLDGDGFLFLTDRGSFLIISGGVNIYPREIEDALALHPAVQDIAVIGVPDPDLGEQVKAVVEPAPGSAPGPDLERELLAFLQDRIARYKIPRSVDFVDRLPRTETGKLRKHLLRERYAPTSG